MLPFAAPTAEKLKRVLVAGSLSPTPYPAFLISLLFFFLLDA